MINKNIKLLNIMLNNNYYYKKIMGLGIIDHRNDMDSLILVGPMLKLLSPTSKYDNIDLNIHLKKSTTKVAISFYYYYYWIYPR
jgi:hypothetical protein